MSTTSTDRIEKQIELRAPPSRVWRALTDHREFGAWFRVNLEGPFELGKVTRGRITHPGYEHLVMEVRVETMEAERRSEAFRSNEQGWSQQIKNIEAHVSAAA